MSDTDSKLGEEMARMHIGALVELGIIPPPPPVEIRSDDDGGIDEVVAKRCDLHIERLGGNEWFLSIEASDGSYWQFFIGSKRSMVEMRHTETIPAAPK